MVGALQALFNGSLSKLASVRILTVSHCSRAESYPMNLTRWWLFHSVWPHKGGCVKFGEIDIKGAN